MDLSGELGPPDSVKDLLLSAWIEFLFLGSIWLLLLLLGE